MVDDVFTDTANEDFLQWVKATGSHDNHVGPLTLCGHHDPLPGVFALLKPDLMSDLKNKRATSSCQS